jgi:hypothetical protein
LTEKTIPPFSARNRGAHAQIDNDCPETTRIGLLHLVHRLVDRKYVENWNSVVGELQRIARVRPDCSNAYPDDAEPLLLTLAWDKVFDFCERLYSHLITDVYEVNPENDQPELITRKSDAQDYVTGEMQRLFLEENLAFEFSNGLVQRRGRRNTANQVARAEVVLGDRRLSAARAQFNKALKFFRNVPQPDYENAVKEAVCAVEATARALFPSRGTTLGDVVKAITGSEPGKLPKAIAKTFDGLYGFRSGGEGVGHGGATGGAVTKELAEYSLAVAASQIVLLVDVASALEPDEVPF